MRHKTLRRRFAATCTVGLVAALAAGTGVANATTTSPTHVTGTLPDGSTYVIDKPANWNGTVLLYSHGIVPSGYGLPNPAQDATSPVIQARLLQQGYALVGSSYVTTGWVVDTAVPDQMAALGAFAAKFGNAAHTIAWGGSMGGLVTTKIAETHGQQIDGSLAFCGLEQGGVSEWNSALDLSYAVSTLLAPGANVQLAGYSDAAAAQSAAATLTGAATAAQNTAAGRARIALANALYNVPAYNNPGQSAPGAGDWSTAEANQYQNMTGVLLQMTTLWRQDAEAHAGGNMSWNTGVDYGRMLANSVDLAEVKALYKTAGLSLNADLAALGSGKRVTADPNAVAFMASTSALTGQLTKPQLDAHTVGDGLVAVQSENAYRTEVDQAGAASLLRQTYVNAPGHCNFTTGEVLAAIQTINDRVDTGHWGSTSAAAMNKLATAADPADAAAFEKYQPSAYPRPFFLDDPFSSDPGHRG